MKRKFIDLSSYVGRIKKNKDMPINSLIMNTIIGQDSLNFTKLLEAGKTNQYKDFDINFCNKEGISLLHVAIDGYVKTKTSEAERIIRQLIEAGADLRYKNSKEETAGKLLEKLFPHVEEDSESTEPLPEGKDFQAASVDLTELFSLKNVSDTQSEVKLVGIEQNKENIEVQDWPY